GSPLRTGEVPGNLRLAGSWASGTVPRRRGTRLGQGQRQEESAERMNKRKLLIGLLVAGLLSAGFGTAIFPASADQRTFVITLATGQTVTVTEDVPAGTPITDVQPPPNIATPVVGVQEVPTSTA